METYINAGFGELLSDGDLMLIRSLGFDGIRQNVPSPEHVGLVDNILESGLHAIFIVPVETPDICQTTAHAVAERAAELGRSSQAVLEVGNEEDLGGKRWAKDPHGWAALVSDVCTIAASHRFMGPVVSGGVSSVSHTALRWLKDSRVSELPVGVGYHQYRSTPPNKPLDGYHSRDEEYRALADAAGGSETWCTESGWTTTPHSKGWGPFRQTWAYSDVEVLGFLRAEIALATSYGAQSFTVYQLNDGPDPNNGQDRFGIRRMDGTLKPQSRVLLT